MLGLDDILALGLKIIDKVIPDPAQKAAAQLQLAQLQQTGELAQMNADLQMATAQTDIDKTEASSENLFVSGWRPAIGWVCAMAFFYHFILQPFLIFFFDLFGMKVATPDFDMSTLYTVLMGMLGLGTMRTIEKLKS